VVTSAGEGNLLVFTSDFSGIVDKFRTLTTVEFQDRERDGGSYIRKGLKSPGMSVIEEGVELSD
jgi:hypothetical protein